MKRALAAVAAALSLAPAASAPAADASWGFMTRSGSHLMLDGKPFRFSGSNIEWLGLVGYGPQNHDPAQTERFPSAYEVDDVLATAKEMGTTVIRAQTLGDTVGCANCLEPKLGQFNEQEFRVMDYALTRARAYGIRLILEFQGDSGAVGGTSSADVFSGWRGGASFWTDPTVIKDFENHIEHIVNRVNSYTGVAYKDDPTIVAWQDCNLCQLWSGANSASWDTQIAAYVKSLDKRHLFLSNAFSFVPPDPSVLADPNIDLFSTAVYPHWVEGASGDRLTGTAPNDQAYAAYTAAAGKAFMYTEIGWDHTDWQTTTAFQTFLSGIEGDPNISGDLFWAVEAHTNGHGWKPLPANNNCSIGNGAGCETGEDGNWWALYYTGIDTLSNTAADMAQRAQMLRTHAYRMRGLRTPPHDVPPAPIITSTDGGKVVFEGAAGAAKYSVEKLAGATWTTLCDRCTTDAAGGWTDPGTPGCYRVVGYNLDGVAGPPSTPAGTGCPKTAAAAPSTCASKRSVRYTVPIGATRARVTVDGKPRPLRRRGRTLLLSLNGLARRTVTVRITWRQHGRRHVRTSLLHPCTTSRKSS